MPDVSPGQANWFTEISKAPVISRMTGKKVLDGTGQLTVQVEILCIVQNNEKSMSSVVMSAGSGLTDSVISEAAEASERKREQSVATALEWIREALNPLLKGLVPTEQLKADQLLSDYFTEKLEEQVRKQEVKEAEFPLVPVPSKPVTPLKKRKNSPKGRRSPTSEKSIPPAEPAEPVLKGSIAIGATSLAVAKAGSVVNKSPLYLYIASLKHKQQLAQKMTMPIPLVTLLSCGKSAPGKMNLMKEVIGIPSTDLTIRESIDVFLALQKQISVLTDKVTKAGPVVKNLTSLGCIALACDRLEQPLDIIQEACNHLRLELGRNIQLAINCAAHELMDYTKGKYEVMNGNFKSPDEMVDMYVDLISRYPSIIALIDPLRKEDQEQWTNIYNTLSSKCYLIAEAATKSVSKLLESRNTNIPRSSGLVMKHIDGTTISHLIEVVQLVEGENQITIMGSMEEESSEDSLADLAVGLEARFIKLGGLIRGERATKYNRLLVIEEEMRDSEILDQRQNHTFPYIADKPQTSLKSNTTPSEETEEGHHQ
ncbi:enolase 4 isoform X3 [Microcaecilia unicolor]|uniref:phosphopyruvate hydratase n=1 Tax=Microcaecilia unicolor TaxID=1415580 RepID=A0A6P7YC35_9AMPH|nr:enolase 4 isoform X3 [Microcaecilia unicolor]